MSSSTTSLGNNVVTPDCLRTNGFACPMIASLSSVCLARISCTMPITLLATMSRPNSPLITEPVSSTIKQQHTQDRVDPGEDVSPDDIRDAARGALRDGVVFSLGYPLRHLGIAETGDGHRVNVPNLFAS